MKATRKTSYFPLKGGEDLVTPQFSKVPGTLSASKNFECDSGGRYRRIDGYERLDGQAAPSDASYWLVTFTGGTEEIAVGATVTDVITSGTGEVLIVAVLTSGSYVGNDAAGHLILGSVSGTFASGHNLQVSAATKAVSAGSDSENASGSDFHDTYIQAAIEALRAKITAVPGTGDILGVVSLKFINYAFRANAGNTAVDMYKSSAAGWTKITLGDVLYFDAGTVTPIIGETVTGGGSSETATIKRFIVTDGAWSTSDAEGYLVLSGATGAFTNNEALTTVAGAMVANGTNTTIALAIGGRYDFRVHNFYGHSGSVRIYGCDGVNNGFEFDGTTYVPIYTGMVSDAPIHLDILENYLHFSFLGGSLQNSSVGEPLVWDAVTGAAEIGLGDEITGLEVMQGDTLAVVGTAKTSVLYESDGSWSLKTLSRKYGGREWSLQKGTEVYFLGSAGISALSTIEAYGDFESSPISAKVKPLLKAKLSTFSSSISVRDKEQYRMYFTDNTGVCLTFDGNKPVGFTQLAYRHKVCCTWESVDTAGGDVLLFGSEDGWVFQLDKGTSFDGASVQSFLRAWRNTLQNPERKKRFLKVAIEKDNVLTEGYWGIGKWGQFEWGLQSDSPPSNYIDAVGNGYEYSYAAEETYTSPYTLQGGILHYSNGGLNR